ncbi:transglutaminase-like cysteine peptidase [Pseudoalteromonas sp. FUC4]|uniref:transglutaminase-like cysteine peptidase n=1 Tax=Pseudoalteromonas sp. FUC4 TaxID=2511201 RepID=UPI0021CEA0FA|nr:transglutaminase-like cysteine peptidase [Pseudoalteromonas sp. FUC4]
MKKKIIFICMCVFSLFVFSQKIEDKLNNKKLLQLIENKYNKNGVNRYGSWLKLLENSQSASKWSQLNTVNMFFNEEIKYYEDIDFWNKKDYWASPIETIGRGGGDCEDYAIAKYFSLLTLGFPEDKLRLMYVRQLTVDVPHMVLIYLENDDSPPLILDNYEHKILPATKRPDLKPIYSFNGHGLWLSKARGIGKKVRNQHGLKSWQDMIERIEVDINVSNGEIKIEE